MFGTKWLAATVVSAWIYSCSGFGRSPVAEGFESPEGNFTLRISQERGGTSLEQGEAQGGGWLAFVYDNSRRRIEWYPVPVGTTGLLRGSVDRDVFLRTFFDDYVASAYEADGRVPEQLHNAFLGSDSDRTYHVVVKLQPSSNDAPEDKPSEGGVLLSQTLIFMREGWCYVLTLTSSVPKTDSLQWDVSDLLALRDQMTFE